MKEDKVSQIDLATRYAAEEMKKEGFWIDPKVTKRALVHVIHYMITHLENGEPFRFPNLGTFQKEYRAPRKMYCQLTKSEITTRPKISLKFDVSRYLLKRFRQEEMEKEREMNENK